MRMESLEKNLLTLTKQVKERVNKPVNVSVTQAIIESFGIRQVDVLDDFGIDTIEMLAKQVHESIINQNKKEKKHSFSKKNEMVFSSDYFVVKLKVFVTQYFVGTFHLLPIFIQILSIILFGYSLWTAKEFNILQSTSVVVGVITSFVFTGGIVSVISKQISFYWNHKNDEMVFNTTVYFIKRGLQFLFIINILILIFSFLLGFFSFEMMLLSTVYSLSIGTILLFIAPLHVVKRRWAITCAIVSGSTISLFLRFFTALHVYVTHFIGMFVVILFLVITLIIYFKGKNQSFSGFLNSKNVSSSFMVYNNYVYFFYGSFFYLYIFLDRILAWSVLKNERFSYFIFFEKDYEIGMDLAILSYIFSAGVLEYSIGKFTLQLDNLQNKVTLENYKEYNQLFIKDYWKNIVLLIATGIGSFLIQFIMVYSSYGYTFQFDEQLNSLNIEICIIGSIGYFFLSWAVLNVLYFFTLGQPKIALNSLLISFFCNLLIGLLLSRLFFYHYSVYGFMIGSLVFMLITTKKVLRFFNSMDYHYYAAY